MCCILCSSGHGIQASQHSGYSSTEQGIHVSGSASGAVHSIFLVAPAFGDQGTESSCRTRRQDLGTDLYCSVGMRQVAESFGRSLPKRGFSTVELVDWQIAQSKHMLDKVQSEIKPGRKRQGEGAQGVQVCSYVI